MTSDSRTRATRVAATFVLLTLLAGCATYRPQPLSAPATAAAFSQRSLDGAGLRDFMQTQLGECVAPWPLHRWTLDQLTLAALYYHPKLALARAQWASARAKAITAGAYPNPTLQFLPEYITNPGALSPWTIGLSVNVPIVTAGKRAYRTAEALDQAEAARLDVIQTAWQIRANVRQPLLKLDAAQRRRTLLDAQFQDASALLAALKQRLSAGQTSQYKVVQARLRWSNAQLARADAEAAERQARTALAGAVGVPVAALHRVTLDFAAMQDLPASNSLPVARFKTYALTRRPDIRAALMRYAASAQALKLEIARQYPDLQIGPGYQWDQGSHRWSIGFSLSLPVFNQNQGPIAQARAQRQVLAARFRVLQEQITTRFDSALAAYQAGRHKLTLAQHLLSASHSRLASARAAFRVGESNRVDLLRIRLETQNDRLALLQARVQAEKALAALENTLEYPLRKPTATSHAIQHIAPPMPDSSSPPDAKSASS
jgi:cobalt-zinc-cadmium efflux system outer membrane protein